MGRRLRHIWFKITHPFYKPPIILDEMYLWTEKAHPGAAKAWSDLYEKYRKEFKSETSHNRSKDPS